jgi:hypothetical protein
MARSKVLLTFNQELGHLLPGEPEDGGGGQFSPSENSWS